MYIVQIIVRLKCSCITLFMLFPDGMHCSNSNHRKQFVHSIVITNKRVIKFNPLSTSACSHCPQVKRAPQIGCRRAAKGGSDSRSCCTTRGTQRSRQDRAVKIAPKVLESYLTAKRRIREWIYMEQTFVSNHF